MTKFYTFSQNNSGGYFDINENVREYVIIEAEDHNQANKKAEEISIYFNGCETGQDCDCCGDRWSEAWESDGRDEPMIYGTAASETEASIFRKSCFIYYLNGKKEEIIFK